MDMTEITSVVNRIAMLTDLRDWEGLHQCFTDRVTVDYTSLMGGQPESIAAHARDLNNASSTGCNLDNPTNFKIRGEYHDA